MVEIKKNMYVRTNDGYIAKYDGSKHDCDGKYYGFDSTIKDIRFTTDDDDEFLWESQLKTHIIKSSYNIIDLIEEGDILKVNDFKDVYTIYEVEMFRNPYTNEKYLGIRNDFSKRPKRLYEIPLVNLSIVTKEQFEAMEYRI